jgi:peroxiredoxin
MTETINEAVVVTNTRVVQDDPPPERLSRRLLTSILILSMAFNLFLAWQLRRAKDGLGRQPSGEALIPGTVVSPIKASDMDGKTVMIDLASKNEPTILYVFNPNCHWCTRNMANVRALSNATKGRYNLIGLSLQSDELTTYARKNNLDIPLYALQSYSVIPELRLGGTPETILISQDGKVVKSWLGAFDSKASGEIQSIFNVQLPGLLPEPHVDATP